MGKTSIRNFIISFLVLFWLLELAYLLKIFPALLNYSFFDISWLGFLANSFLLHSTLQNNSE